MSGTARLTVNGITVTAPLGQSVLDAALAGGIVIPQDCCTGQCGTCRCEIIAGSCHDAGTLERGSVLACQARVTGDAEFRFDPVPLEMKTSGEVRAIRPLGGEILEVVLRVNKNVPYLPGQYVKVQFSGFPERDFSPTLTLEGLRELDEIILHIRQLETGAVSPALGHSIQPGTRFKLRGPFGHAFLRQGEGRLVMASTGTGFAPLWAMAVAARLGQPWRELAIVASARDPQNLYMRPAMDWLLRQNVNAMTLCASGASPLPPARHGRALEFLPHLTPSDTVYACGAPEMVEAVKTRALAAGAAFYADPFHAAPPAREPLGRKLLNLIRPKAKSPVHASIEALSEGLRNQRS
jgi:naphthalene 1,2-dioxygenase ferredoxin reductase component